MRLPRAGGGALRRVAAASHPAGQCLLHRGGQLPSLQVPRGYCHYGPVGRVPARSSQGGFRTVGFAGRGASSSGDRVATLGGPTAVLGNGSGIRNAEPSSTEGCGLLLALGASAVIAAGVFGGDSLTGPPSASGRRHQGYVRCEEAHAGSDGGAASGGRERHHMNGKSRSQSWRGNPKDPKFARSWNNEKVTKQTKDYKQDDIMLLSGNGNPVLASKIASHLGIELAPVKLGRFSDGEINLQVRESCRGKDIFIIQSTCPPVNENLLELLIMISTCRRASAKRITAVIPYYGYARQDRKMASRVPITAADVAKLLEAMGVDRVVCVDLHCGAIQGFFPPAVPVDNLSAMTIGQDYFMRLDAEDFAPLDNIVVVSPDAGGVYYCGACFASPISSCGLWAKSLGFQEGMIARGKRDARLAMLVKQRRRPNEVARMDLVGEVAGCDAIIVDDMIDTAGTMCEAARELKKAGAKRVFAFATHGLLSGPALERIRSSELDQLVITDSVVVEDGRADVSNIKIVSIAVVLAEGLRRIYLKSSLEAVFYGKASEDA